MRLGLYNIPHTQEEINRWTFINADIHVRMNQYIARHYSKNLDYFVLDPVNEASFETWLWNHQTIHNETNAVLGVIGNDLTGLNWRDEEVLKSWIQNHGQEHYQWSLKTGV